MPVIPVPGREHTWAALTPATAFVFGVESGAAAGADTRVSQWYWGPRPPDAALPELAVSAASWMASSFVDPADATELLPVDGGRRWGVPALQAVYDGGVRSVELAFEEAVSGENEIELVLRDRAYGLRVSLHVRAHHDSDVIERWVGVTNESAVTVRLTRLDSGSWALPEQAGHRYLGAAGGWARETQPHRGDLPVGETTFGSRTGATSHKANPWIMIGDATEDAGQVWGVALAWSGSWRLTAQRRPEGDLAISAGFGHDGLSWPLAPGESLRTPPALGLHTPAGGYGAASRAWHDYARRHVLPTPDEERPVLYNSWEATWFDVTEEGQLDLARRAAHLGVELFVVDDGWFGARTDDTKGLGDWWPNPDRFPQGLGELFDGVRALGMRAGLWVEPEMVNPDSDLYRKHPDWALHYPDRRRDTMRNQLVLNFARPDVRAWALDWLDRLVREYRLDYLKWDMNRGFSQAGPGDLLWIEHSRGVYAIMDELRGRHPRLRIESCSGGGGRIDYGILRRTDQVWTSDNTDARDRQEIQRGYSYLYPASAMSCWVTDSPNPISARRVPLRYRFHVAMAGTLGVGGDLTTWEAGELAEAAQLIADYKAVRRVIQHGALHRLAGTPGTTASALQYTLGDQAVVLAYNPFALDKHPPRRVRLAGLDPAARYADTDGHRWHGATLMHHGLALPTWHDYGPDYRSEMVVLRRI
ncbi:alpha-galactosidase [Nonomuraea sp. NN258]|uniref:alpha-galactosidase n=1 Tax=Nonomuraea antri TaxID=2730852 RepID=UPI0015699DD6|nr:alpha-galactosidase [Nonomuraea antri]NRQ36283.1 alpha-galactosidase [Nonomuraea antri]